MSGTNTMGNSRPLVAWTVMMLTAFSAKGIKASPPPHRPDRAQINPGKKQPPDKFRKAIDFINETTAGSKTRSEHNGSVHPPNRTRCPRSQPPQPFSNLPFLYPVIRQTRRDQRIVKNQQLLINTLMVNHKIRLGEILFLIHRKITLYHC